VPDISAANLLTHCGDHQGSLVDALLTGAPLDAQAGSVPFRVGSTGTDAELESAAGQHLQRG
jgi:hypothetical protein